MCVCLCVCMRERPACPLTQSSEREAPGDQNRPCRDTCQSNYMGFCMSGSGDN